MKLDRWDPFRDMLDFYERMNRRLECPAEEGRSLCEAAWNPAVDAIETPEAYLFRAELPGVGRDNISIEIEGTMLTLEGTRHLEDQPRIAAYHSIERNHGVFRRRFRLPGEVDADCAVATYVDGVLELWLPKASQTVEPRVAIVCVG